MEAHQKVELQFAHQTQDDRLSVQFELNGPAGYVVELSDQLNKTIKQFERTHQLRLIDLKVNE